MKLVKLSLAAVVAAGSFSFANAVALDEAIQNVDLSGYLRYRYDGKSVEIKGTETKANRQVHKYKAQLKLAADIADNFKATAVMQYGEVVDGTFGDDATLHTDNSLNVRDAYFTYSNFDTDISFGRMEIGSFWTDDLLGTGIKAVNHSIEGVTLAAYMFDNYNADSDFFAGVKGDTATIKAEKINGVSNSNKTVEIPLSGSKAGSYSNLYGIAAMVDFAPVSAELWVSYLTDVATLYAVDLRADLGDEDLSYYAHAQFAGNSLKGDFKKPNGATEDQYKNGMLWGIEFGANAFGADFNVGYLTFGDKKLKTIHTLEDDGAIMNYGEIVMSNGGKVEGQNNYIFGTIGYTYDSLRFGVDIISGEQKTEGSKTTKFEVNPRITYNYSEKLAFEAWYANATEKVKDSDDKKTTQAVRLEAKYSF